MTQSLTLTLSGTSSVLEAHYFPTIELSTDKNYVLGLVEFLTFNSIPNIDKSHNKFYVGEKIINIPVGSYEIEDIDKHLNKRLTKENIDITLKANNNTLRSSIKCNQQIDFRPEDSIGRLLGFNPRVLEPNLTHNSDQPVAILKINALRIECNITSGAYINGQRAHIIHEFFPTAPSGYKIVEVPSQVIYLPVTVKCIDHLQIRIVDQDGHLVNFRGEIITVRLHIKQL